MELGDLLVGLGIGAIIIVGIFILLLPIIVSLGLGILIANYFAVSGFLWWCVVIFMAAFLYGVLYFLYKK